MENGKTICMASCATKFYREDTDVVSGDTYLKCSDSCDSNIYRMDNGKRICTATCPDNYYLEDTDVISGQTYFKCAAACAVYTDYQVINGEKTYCYATCPAGYTFIGGKDNSVCLKSCDSETYTVQNGKNLCVATCGKFYEKDTTVISG